MSASINTVLEDLDHQNPISPSSPIPHHQLYALIILNNILLLLNLLHLYSCIFLCLNTSFPSSFIYWNPTLKFISKAFPTIRQVLMNSHSINNSLSAHFHVHGHWLLLLCHFYIIPPFYILPLETKHRGKDTFFRKLVSPICNPILSELQRKNWASFSQGALTLPLWSPLVPHLWEHIDWKYA